MADMWRTDELERGTKRSVSVFPKIKQQSMQGYLLHICHFHPRFVKGMKLPDCRVSQNFTIHVSGTVSVNSLCSVLSALWDKCSLRRTAQRHLPTISWTKTEAGSQRARGDMLERSE